MPKGPNGERRPADVIGNAVHVMRIATGEIEENTKAQSGRTRSGKAGREPGAAKMLKAAYDPRSDVLYLSKGPPVPALSDQDDDGLLLRRAIETGEPVGVTVLMFSKWVQYHAELAHKVASFLDLPYTESEKVLRSIENEINA